jgi:twitching motility protein PilT
MGFSFLTVNAQLLQLIGVARDHGASDLHIEAGLPAALRIRGQLRALDQALPPKDTLAMAQSLLQSEGWNQFLQRRSADLSVTAQGIRCRINILQTARGVGMAIRILAAHQVTLEALNLHPDLKRLAQAHTGLLVVTGPTGSGKSSTVAAYVEEINQTEARNIITIESPIEFLHRPKKAYLRQREVGRDTPSFEQALMDALREDPDVLVVGEMRDPSTMRLTLSAAETGHLVITTMHSGTATEALQRLVSSFSPEAQSSVRAQLADCLVGVIAQRLRYRPDLKLRVPECEVLIMTHATRAQVRAGDFHKLASSIETGAEHGMWSFARYSHWIENRKQWFNAAELPPAEPDEPPASVLPPLPSPGIPQALPRPVSTPPPPPPTSEPTRPGRRIEIEPIEGAVDELLKRLGPS